MPKRFLRIITLSVAMIGHILTGHAGKCMEFTDDRLVHYMNFFDEEECVLFNKIQHLWFGFVGAEDEIGIVPETEDEIRSNKKYVLPNPEEIKSMDPHGMKEKRPGEITKFNQLFDAFLGLHESTGVLGPEYRLHLDIINKMYISQIDDEFEMMWPRAVRDFRKFIFSLNRSKYTRKDIEHKIDTEECRKKWFQRYCMGYQNDKTMKATLPSFLHSVVKTKKKERAMGAKLVGFLHSVLNTPLELDLLMRTCKLVEPHEIIDFFKNIITYPSGQHSTAYRSYVEFWNWPKTELFSEPRVHTITRRGHNFVLSFSSNDSLEDSETESSDKVTFKRSKLYDKKIIMLESSEESNLISNGGGGRSIITPNDDSTGAGGRSTHDVKNKKDKGLSSVSTNSISSDSQESINSTIISTMQTSFSSEEACNKSIIFTIPNEENSIDRIHYFLTINSTPYHEHKPEKVSTKKQKFPISKKKINDEEIEWDL